MRNHAAQDDLAVARLDLDPLALGQPGRPGDVAGNLTARFFPAIRQ